MASRVEVPLGPNRIHSYKPQSMGNNAGNVAYSRNSQTQLNTRAQEFIYSVQCSLYKFDTTNNSWTNLENSRNCVVQLYKVKGKSIVSASLKRSGVKFFEYSITSKLYFGNLDDHLYQLNDRNNKDEIWGISFLVRNDGTNFANKFEDLIQYEPGSEGIDVPLVDPLPFLRPDNIGEEIISLSTEELTTLSYPLQIALETGNIAQGQYCINLLCGLPESHRKFVFQNRTTGDNHDLEKLRVVIENLEEVERIVEIEVPIGITINTLKEIFFIRFGIRRELQKWIMKNNISIGKDLVDLKFDSNNVVNLLILSHQSIGLQDNLTTHNQSIL
ncbi:hypothetical protein LOD99_9792 [Oopsacas minuta]|uniref:Uncharacterized protein n=1 Tax=Oopsacas minuta TaxID=111878 RepID=A0AAV7KMH6_9METZ|nr:hypothetical protein LOD99_9792 [Oopsacas minuta]